MKIIEEDYKRGLVKLQVETIDDLWILYNVLREDDVVYAKTTREIKVCDYSHGGSRVPMMLGIKVKRVEFQQFSNRLRVGGVVVDGPEEYGIKGKHHTFAIGIGDTLTIIKSEWSEVEVKLIRKYIGRRGSVLILSVDLDEACIGILSEQGVRYLWENALNLPSKVYQVDYEKMFKEFINEISKKVLDAIQRDSVEAILIVGPGEIKNHVRNKMANEVSSLPIYVESTSTGGCRGINEALGRDSIRQIIGDLSVVKAKGILEEFKQLLVKEHEMVSYGIRDVYEVSQIGAIRVVIVIDELLKTPNDEERTTVYEALKKTHECGGEVIIVPSKSDVGLELQGFGGIIAILRFKLYKA